MIFKLNWVMYWKKELLHEKQVTWFQIRIFYSISKQKEKKKKMFMAFIPGVNLKKEVGKLIPENKTKGCLNGLQAVFRLRLQ